MIPSLGELVPLALRWLRGTSAAQAALGQTAAELSGWRRGIETAGWVHMNAAGASPSHHSSHAAMVGMLTDERQIGGYAAASKRANEGGRDAREALAQLLSCDAAEIALMESAQAAWAKAFYSLRFAPGDCIVCFESEYAGNAVAFIQASKRSGCDLEVLPMLPDGLVDLRMLRDALSRRSRCGRTVVALTHVQTDSSVIQAAIPLSPLPPRVCPCLRTRLAHREKRFALCRNRSEFRLINRREFRLKSKRIPS